MDMDNPQLEAPASVPQTHMSSSEAGDETTPNMYPRAISSRPASVSASVSQQLEGKGLPPSNGQEKEQSTLETDDATSPERVSLPESPSAANSRQQIDDWATRRTSAPETLGESSRSKTGIPRSHGEPVTTYAADPQLFGSLLRIAFRSDVTEIGPFLQYLLGNVMKKVATCFIWPSNQHRVRWWLSYSIVT